MALRCFCKNRLAWMWNKITSLSPCTECNLLIVCCCEGLQLDVAKFFKSFLTLFLTAMGGASLCLAVSARVSVYSVAHLISTFIFVVMMVRLYHRCINAEEKFFLTLKLLRKIIFITRSA